jgi:molecular chaperone HtpG
MIHSLYSHREIFLRELISNASDAATSCASRPWATPNCTSRFRLKIRSVRQGARAPSDRRQRHRHEPGGGHRQPRHDREVRHREFFRKLTGDQQKDASLIGQFGVGFYSAFIVADRVTLVTRRAGLDRRAGRALGVRGRRRVHASRPSRSPRAAPRSRCTCARARTIFLSGWKLATSCASTPTTSSLPIVMKKEEWDGRRRRAGRPRRGRDRSTRRPLWARPKSEITDEQYKEFYKHVGHDFEAPLAWTHARVEGRQEYTQLLYIPGHAPFDLWDREHRNGIKLYVRRVFIMDDAEQLMPAYLRFVRGVIDSSDLPLNVSREILQESKDVEAIRNGCTKKVLGLLEDLAENDKEEVREVLGRVRPRAEGRRRRGPRQQGKHREAAALRLDPRRHRRGGRLARRLRRRA